MHSKSFALLAAGAIATLIAAGCAKQTDQSTTSSTTTTTATTTSAPAATSASATLATTGVPQGDAAHGKAIFTSNCAGCHGANGEGGGIGPTLKNEKSRKNFEQTVAQIKNPKSPMPKLYPASLNDKDVNDVAAFVQTL
jgi:mono/diheme cytochrome c family protein